MLLLTRALPIHLLKLYKFYLNLESDAEVRKYYRYLTTRRLLGRVYAFLFILLNLIMPWMPRRTCFYILLDNNIVKGACHITIYRIKKNNKKRYNIGMYGIVIDKSVRGKGIGRILSLYAILNSIKRFQLKRIYLTVDIDNIKAIKLYIKLGFRIISIAKRYGYRYFSNEYVDAYIMVLDINNLRWA